jgi:hypothetical protein
MDVWFDDTGKALKLQVSALFTVDSRRIAEVPSQDRHVTLMPRFFRPIVFAAHASYWWWYGIATEGATASV